jgi:hypothetical protein
LPEPEIAIFSNSYSPSLIALNIATLSAQTVAGYDEFSIFAPVYIFPLFVNRQAPTLNFEYGQ